MAQVVIQLTESHQWAQADAERRLDLLQPGDVIGVYRDEQDLGKLVDDEKFIILTVPNLAVATLLDYRAYDADLRRTKRLDLSALRASLTGRQRQDLDSTRKLTLTDADDTRLRAATVTREIGR